MRRARRPRAFTSTDVLTLVGCAVSALALTWMVFTVLVGGGSWFGFLVVAYLVFLGLFALVTSDRLGRLVATDRVATVVISSFTLLLVVPLVWIIGYIVVRGLPGLTWRFFTQDQRGITPLRPGDRGRWRPRPGGHPRAGRHGAHHQRAHRRLHRGVPQRDPPPAAPSGPHRHRRHERPAVGARRTLHLHRDHHPVRQGREAARLQRIHGGARAVAHHGPHHHPHRRGGAAARARRPPRSGPRRRRLAGPGRVVGRAAHRAHRPHHGGDPRHRPRHRRDRAASVHVARVQLHERQPGRRPAGEPAAVHLPEHPQPVGHHHPARGHRGARADDDGARRCSPWRASSVATVAPARPRALRRSATSARQS